MGKKIDGTGKSGTTDFLYGCLKIQMEKNAKAIS